MPKRRPAPKLLLPPAPRGAIHPIKNVATTTVSAGIGIAGATVLVGQVPALAPFHAPLAALLTGVFAGIGNRARTAGGVWKYVAGWL